MDYTVTVEPKQKTRLILGPAPIQEGGLPRYSETITSATDWEVGQVEVRHETMQNRIIVAVIHNRSTHPAFIRFFRDGEFIPNPMSESND